MSKVNQPCEVEDNRGHESLGFKDQNFAALERIYDMFECDPCLPRRKIKDRLILKKRGRKGKARQVTIDSKSKSYQKNEEISGSSSRQPDGYNVEVLPLKTNIEKTMENIIDNKSDKISVSTKSTNQNQERRILSEQISSMIFEMTNNKKNSLVYKSASFFNLLENTTNKQKKETDQNHVRVDSQLDPNHATTSRTNETTVSTTNQNQEKKILAEDSRSKINSSQKNSPDDKSSGIANLLEAKTKEQNVAKKNVINTYLEDKDAKKSVALLDSDNDLENLLVLSKYYDYLHLTDSIDSQADNLENLLEDTTTETKSSNLETTKEKVVQNNNEKNEEKMEKLYKLGINLEDCENVVLTTLKKDTTTGNEGLSDDDLQIRTFYFERPIQENLKTKGLKNDEKFLKITLSLKYCVKDSHITSKSSIDSFANLHQNKSEETNSFNQETKSNFEDNNQNNNVEDSTLSKDQSNVDPDMSDGRITGYTSSTAEDLGINNILSEELQENTRVKQLEGVSFKTTSLENYNNKYCESVPPNQERNIDLDVATTDVKTNNATSLPNEDLEMITIFFGRHQENSKIKNRKDEPLIKINLPREYYNNFLAIEASKENVILDQSHIDPDVVAADANSLSDNDKKIATSRKHVEEARTTKSEDEDIAITISVPWEFYSHYLATEASKNDVSKDQSDIDPNVVTTDATSSFGKDLKMITSTKHWKNDTTINTKDDNKAVKITVSRKYYNQYLAAKGNKKDVSKDDPDVVTTDATNLDKDPKIVKSSSTKHQENATTGNSEKEDKPIQITVPWEFYNQYLTTKAGKKDDSKNQSNIDSDVVTSDVTSLFNENPEITTSRKHEEKARTIKSKDEDVGFTITVPWEFYSPYLATETSKKSVFEDVVTTDATSLLGKDPEIITSTKHGENKTTINNKNDDKAIKITMWNIDLDVVTTDATSLYDKDPKIINSSSTKHQKNATTENSEKEDIPIQITSTEATSLFDQDPKVIPSRKITANNKNKNMAINTLVPWEYHNYRLSTEASKKEASKNQSNLDFDVVTVVSTDDKIQDDRASSDENLDISTLFCENFTFKKEDASSKMTIPQKHHNNHFKTNEETIKDLVSEARCNINRKRSLSPTLSESKKKNVARKKLKDHHHPEAKLDAASKKKDNQTKEKHNKKMDSKDATVGRNSNSTILSKDQMLKGISLFLETVQQLDFRDTNGTALYQNQFQSSNKDNLKIKNLKTTKTDQNNATLATDISTVQSICDDSWLVEFLKSEENRNQNNIEYKLFRVGSPDARNTEELAEAIFVNDNFGKDGINVVDDFHVQSALDHDNSEYYIRYDSVWKGNKRETTENTTINNNLATKVAKNPNKKTDNDLLYNILNNADAEKTEKIVKITDSLDVSNNTKHEETKITDQEKKQLVQTPTDNQTTILDFIDGSNITSANLLQKEETETADQEKKQPIQAPTSNQSSDDNLDSTLKLRDLTELKKPEVNTNEEIEVAKIMLENIKTTVEDLNAKIKKIELILTMVSK